MRKAVATRAKKTKGPLAAAFLNRVRRCLVLMVGTVAMQFDIPLNSQFAAITIEPISISQELPELIDLGDGRYILVRPSFEIEPFWQGQLGEIKSKKISENSLLLLVVVGSDCSDGSIDKELIRSVRSIFYSLFLQGIYFTDGGTVLCGGKTSGRVSIRSVQDLDHYFRPRETVTELLDNRVVDCTRTVAMGLESIYLAKDHYRRLKRGFHSYLDGLKANYEESRMRHFVRTLEAIIQPDIGKTRKHFIYRGRLFVGRSSEMSELLGDIYDLRSCAEHMNDIQELYPDLSQTDIDKRAALRSFQSEVLANYAYRRICENAELRATFATDSGIREFWAKPEQEWMSLWGPAIDLEAKVKERFNPYL
jgi:hypothetical protein